jgi:membrane protein DedA with SNARE-associated domain
MFPAGFIGRFAARLKPPVEHFITNFILRHGYEAVFVLMVLESACVPIPSEVTMLFGGALANATFVSTVAGANRHLNFVVVALLGTLGNLVGSLIAYGVGRAGGRPLIDRWGRYVLLRPHEIDRAESWFHDHGPAAVFFSRLLPVVRTFISLPAGVAEMPLGTFTLYTVAGCLPWTFALAAAGYAVGSQWKSVERYFTPISIVIAVLLVAAIAWWIARRVRSRKGERAVNP